MRNNQLGDFQVLIVDDERTIQRLVMNVLQSLGFKDITAASSGRQAIALLSKQKFDFIITDWRMDDMDGADIIRFVRQSPDSPHPMTPIIMLTGNTEAHYVKTALALGVNGYLIKPFAADQLVRRIRAVIENPRQFVISPNYRGPSRRHTDKGPPKGGERRKPR
jgi:two-component system chemotaxis response regulator CheY